MAIKLPASVRDRIEAQASCLDQNLTPVTREEKEAFVASVPSEFSYEAEEHVDRFAERVGEKRLHLLEEAVLSLTKMLKDTDFGRFQKPLLNLDEAAGLLGVSPKRLDNLICEERKRRGRSPDFIVDAGGLIQRRFLRDALMDWVTGQGRVGRPRKAARAA